MGLVVFAIDLACLIIYSYKVFYYVYTSQCYFDGRPIYYYNHIIVLYFICRLQLNNEEQMFRMKNLITSLDIFKDIKRNFINLNYY